MTAIEIAAAVKRRPTRVVLATQLASLIGALPIGPRREYLQEALGCFESRFHRAAIVLTWCVAYDAIRAWFFANQTAAFNRIMSTWKRPKTIEAITDFDELTERAVLDTAKEAKVVTREQHKALVSLLDRRNSYAHPTGRAISDAAAEAFVEDAVQEVVMVFK
jgi:hypothetical protein